MSDLRTTLLSGNADEIRSAWKQSYKLSTKLAKFSEVKKAEDAGRGSKPEKGEKTEAHLARNKAKKAFREFILSGVDTGSWTADEKKRVHNKLSSLAKNFVEAKSAWKEVKRTSDAWKAYKAAKDNGEKIEKPLIKQEVALKHIKSEYKGYINGLLRV